MLKSILISCSFVLVLTIVNAQDDHLAKASSASVTDVKKSGQFDIVLPGQLTKDEVEKNASYYVHNFTVSFDEKSKNAHITMITNDERSRQVVVRFLSACGVQEVMVDNNTLAVYAFFEKYLK